MSVVSVVTIWHRWTGYDSGVPFPTAPCKRYDETARIVRLLSASVLSHNVLRKVSENCDAKQTSSEDTNPSKSR